MDDLRTDTSSENWSLDSVFSDFYTEAPAPRRFARLQGGSIIALSGELIIPGAIGTQQQKAVLKRMLAKLERLALITTATFDAANDFVDALGGAPLPRIAPESGGGLLMTWATPQGGRTLVTLEDSTLCAVVRSGTDDAEYIEDELFTGEVPQAIVQAIAA